MRILIISLLVICIVGLKGIADEPLDQVDQVFARWDQAQRGIQSLLVDFTLERKDRVFGKTEKKPGTFRMIRTAKGEIYASYEHGPEMPNDTEPKFQGGLLKSTAVYLLDANQKTEIRWKMDEGQMLGVLADYFNPLVVLLDRKRAEEKYSLEVKQDEFYTYVSLTPKKVKHTDWFKILHGQVVLGNKDSTGVPKNMLRRLWYITSNGDEFTFDIKTWRMNAPDGPQVEEFIQPRDRQGWKVQESSWPLPKY